jgi:hypothetical protein
MRLLDLRTLMLGVSALLLVVSALADGRELARHLLDGPSELCQLGGHRRYVLSGCHVKPADSTRARRCRRIAVSVQSARLTLAG